MPTTATQTAAPRPPQSLEFSSGARDGAEECVDLTNISRHIISVSTAVRVRAREAIERCGHRPTAATSLIIPNLPEEGLGMSELARRAGISLQRAGQMVAELEDAGYLRRVSGGGDGRTRRAVYTEEGKRLLGDIEAFKRELLAEFVSILGRPGLEAFVRELERLDTALGGDDGFRIVVG